MKKPELLSPAGNIEALKQAVHHGADAVYLGGEQFGARAFAENFSKQALCDAIAYAHLYGKKIYVTVNTLISQARWDSFIDTVSFLNDIRADAVILQDIGAAKIVSAMFPNLPWHASTQMHNHSAASVMFAKNLGAQRVVLAREMGLAEIRALKTLNLQTEVFIHGALCISYSGQCLFSALTQGRSGNQGACAQVCRMRYALLETKNREIQTLPAEGEFLLSPKDLGALTRIGELMDAGVDAFKIEGRMKSPEYVGYITALYRRLIDSAAENGKSELSEMDMDTLARLFNRGYTEGLLFDAFGKAMMRPERPNHMGVIVGQVTQTRRDRITIKLSAPLNQGDGIKFEKSDLGMIAEKIYQDGLLVSGADAGDTIQLENKPNLSAPDTVLVTFDKTLNARLADYTPIHIPVDFTITAKIGESLLITLSDGVHTLTEKGEIVASAKSTPTDADTVRAQLARLGDTVFEMRTCTFSGGPNIFIPKSELNRLRRILTDRLTELRSCPKVRQKQTPDIVKLFDFSRFNPLGAGFSVLVRDDAQYHAARAYPFVRIYTDHAGLYRAHTQDKRFFYMPPRAGKPEEDDAKQVLVTENGALSEYIGSSFAADYSLNVQNAFSLALLLEKGAGMITLSPELNDQQIKAMTDAFIRRFGFAPPLEAVVYGHFEVMLTKNCIIASALCRQKDCGLCKSASYALQDIHGHIYPIKTDADCHNHIFAAENIDRTNEIDTLESLGATSFRISLLDESAEECTALFSRLFPSGQ